MKQNEKITLGINASYLRKPHTGIGQVTANFIKELANHKFSKTNSNHREFRFILYLEKDLPKNFKLPKGFETRVFLPAWRRDDLIRKIWWEKCLLPRKVKKDGCDIFLSLYQSATVFCHTGTKHMMLVHDIIPEIFPEYRDNFRRKFYWRMVKKGIKRTGRIITVSKRTEKDLISRLEIPAEKITTNYIDADKIFKKPVTQKEKTQILKKYKLKPGYILAGGGMEKRKNIVGVLRAYTFLREKYLSLELPLLVVYGKKLPKNLTLATDASQLVKELNLTGRVKFLGEVSQKNMPAVFANCSVFVYPSLYEGFGLPVLEAMSQGRPVIASKTSSLPEVGGDAIVYTDGKDMYDIAMVLKNVLGKPELRETLSSRAKERAQNFSWKKFVEKFINMLDSLE